MSRCARDVALHNLLDRGGFKRLARSPYRSTAEKYRLIGDAYRIREFAELADAAATTNVGVPDRVAYTRLALTVYQERLADARVRRPSADPDHIANCGYALPLLLLIGAPTFHAISSGLGARQPWCGRQCRDAHVVCAMLIAAWLVLRAPDFGQAIAFFTRGSQPDRWGGGDDGLAWLAASSPVRRW